MQACKMLVAFEIALACNWLWYRSDEYQASFVGGQIVREGGNGRCTTIYDYFFYPTATIHHVCWRKAGHLLRDIFCQC